MLMDVGEKKLRWWGIDMRPRLRRRVAVLGTYCTLGALVGEMPHLARSMPWVTYPFRAHLLYWAAIGFSAMWVYVSIFRPNGVVKSFDEATEKPILVGLNFDARNQYGVASFAEANEEQQESLLRKRRLAKLDERERGERDAAARWAAGWITFLLWYAALQYLGDADLHRTVDRNAVGAVLLGFAVLAMTLPQARVLWTEPDPREMGEMRELRVVLNPQKGT
jgi:hypothetical protein